MANSTGTLQISLSWSQQDQEGSNISNTVTDAGSYVFNRTWNSGVNNEQINNLFHEVRTLTSGGIQAYDITNLTRTIFSGSFSQGFSSVRCVFIENISSGTGANIVVAATGSNGWTNGFNGGSGGNVVAAKSPFIIANYITGFAVTTTNRFLYLNDLGSGCTVRIGILGV